MEDDIRQTRVYLGPVHRYLNMLEEELEFELFHAYQMFYIM